MTVTLGDVVERNERLFPDRLAVSFEGLTYTHAQHAERARRLANALYQCGMRRQDRIVLLAQNCSEYLEAFSAGYLAGFITVTVNYRLAAPEIEYIVNDCQPTAILFDDTAADAIAALRDRLPSVRSYICVGHAPDWAEPYEAVLSDASPDRPPIRAREEDVAYLIYTSGTTGRPKGVMLGHKGQVFASSNFCVEGTIDGDDRVILATPLYHSGGRWVQIGHSWRGCSMFVHRAFDPRATLETIAREKISTVLLPATMLQRVLDVPDFASFDVSSLRTIYYSASPMPVPLLRRAIAALGPLFIQYYGMTEAGGLGCSLLKHQHVVDGPDRLVRRLASAGLPKTSSEVRIVADDGRDCAPGEPGEVLFRTPTLMMGYWGNDAATRETIVDGWLHSGDIGKFDEDGFVYLVDRKKDMIISGGVNIYSKEVEDALYEHPAVADAAVVGKPDKEWGEAVHAFVILKPSHEASEAELIEHCRGLIASFKKPKSIEFVGNLPRLPNGKLNKVVLREGLWAGQIRRVS